MEFTYTAYTELISLLRKNNYEICGYSNHADHSKCVILRHDVDYCLEKALSLAVLENSLDVSATYFILLSSDFYNVASQRDRDIICNIAKLGHSIGLHFDETAYDLSGSDAGFEEMVEKERMILSNLLDLEVGAVSMHRPSKETLTADYKFKNAVNSYSGLFFKEFKYLSDSRSHWREPVLNIIKSNQYDRLHILVHSFWYSENGITAREAIRDYVNCANKERYLQLKGNIRDLNEFMKDVDVK